MNAKENQIMEFGFNIPNAGPMATPGAIKQLVDRGFAQFRKRRVRGASLGMQPDAQATPGGRTKTVVRRLHQIGALRAEGDLGVLMS